MKSHDGIVRVRSGNGFLVSAARSAVTLIELLAALGIVLILAGLALPAVQNARAQAHRLSCASHLRQFGTALHAYHGEYGCLPIPYECDNVGGVKLFSVHSRVLAFLGHSELFDAVNFSVRVLPGSPTGGGVNRTAAATRIAEFVCPADRGFTFSYRAATNYRVNVGPAAELEFSVPLGASPFAPAYTTDFAKLLRGLTHTALMSEKLVGDNVPTLTPARDVLLPRLPPNQPLSNAEYIQVCGAIGPPLPPQFSRHGSTWLLAGTWFTWYNHAVTPNSRIPDCGKESPQPSPGLYSPRSLHAGGVNVLLGDGSVRFVTEAIDSRTWITLGGASEQ